MGERIRHVGAAVLVMLSAFTLLAGCVFGAPTPTLGLRALHAPGATGPWELVAQQGAPDGGGLAPVQVDNGRPRPEQPAQPVPALDCRIERCVALTFDDGPSTDTARLVAVLRAAGVPATFFALGRQVREHPATAQGVAAHTEVGSHGWEHESLVDLTPDQVGSDIHRTDNEISGTIGRRPTLFRPPYGAVDAASTEILRRAGLPIVLWSVDPQDWKVRDAAVVHQRLMQEVRPGSVVLLHDIHSSTVDAVPRIVADLRAQGYVLVTVSQMWDGQLSPGKIYTGRESEWMGSAEQIGQ